jgi:hypothetical protein
MYTTLCGGKVLINTNTGSHDSGSNMQSKSFIYVFSSVVVSLYVMVENQWAHCDQPGRNK